MRKLPSTALIALSAFVAACQLAASGDRGLPADPGSAAGAPATAAPGTTAPDQDNQPLPTFTGASGRTDSPGCGPSSVPQPGPEEGTTSGRGIPPQPPILNSGEEITVDVARGEGFEVLVPGSIPDKLSASVVIGDYRGESLNSVRVYYTPEAIDESDTLADVVAEGGMFLLQRRTLGHTAEFVQGEVGDRATLVEVGTHKAALVWADPIFGVRTYNLYWSDGTYDWTLISGLDTPEMTVDVARSMVC